MNIEDFCRHDVATIDAGASALAAAQAMRERHVGALVVTQGEGAGAQVVGLVTDRDLVVKALAVDAAPAQLAVARLMGGRIVSVPVGASVGDTVAVMREEGVRRVLVAGPGGVLAGIATLDDLLEAMSLQIADLTGALRAGLARERRGPPARAGEAGPALPPTALAARWRQVISP